MKTHTSSFKEQIKLMGKEIDSRITFGSTVLGKDDLNAVTPSYQGAILKSVMKQLDIDSNVEIPIGTILKYEFGLKVNGEYEYINYGNYVVYSIEKQEDTNSYKITCYDKLLYSMLDYVKLPITYPISIRDYINSLSTVLGLKFANKSETFANYNKQIQADLYDGLGYTFRDILDELAQVTASTICLNNNDELEIRYITETGDTIDEEFLKDVNVNFGEKFGAVNTIVLSRSGDSDSVYYPSTLPTNPYEIKISDNQIMNGNDRADFLPDIYNKLNGLEFYTNDFVSTGIIYYDLCDRYSVKVGDNTYSCVMFNDEVLVTQGLEENIYTELPEQTETDYKHASKDDRMINQVYIIAKKNEAEILAVVNTTKQLQKEINPTKDESGSEIIIEDASNNPLTYLEIEGKSVQEIRNSTNKFNASLIPSSTGIIVNEDGSQIVMPTITAGNGAIYTGITLSTFAPELKVNDIVHMNFERNPNVNINTQIYLKEANVMWYRDTSKTITQEMLDSEVVLYGNRFHEGETEQVTLINFRMVLGESDVEWEQYGVSPSPEFPSEIESVGTYNEETGKYGIEVKTVGKNLINISKYNDNNYVSQLLTLKAGTYTVHHSGEEVSSAIYIRKANGTNPINGAVVSEAYNRNRLTFTLEQDGEYYIQFYKSGAGFTSFENAMLNEGLVATDYVPYQKNTSIILLNAPLRSLPNGVKDIAYIRNNKLYVDRYVGSVVLDGSESGWTSFLDNKNIYNYYINEPTVSKIIDKCISNYFTYSISYSNNNSIGEFVIGGNNPNKNGNIIFNPFNDTTNKLNEFKTWLSTHNTQVDYELATPVTEELGEIEMLKTLKGYNDILTTDELLPIINLTYVRDTILADYVENHVTELKLTESEIKASVESVSSSVDGLNTSINRVEEITNDNSQVINIISTNIDKTSGEVREVTTTTGFTFNADGMTIDDGSGFKAQHRANGTYYKDGETIVGQYTKDGSKQKDLELFGTYSYGKESIDDTPMFVGQLYRDENGEECFGHFYNGGDY